jgi:hypothetical protein
MSRILMIAAISCVACFALETTLSFEESCGLRLQAAKAAKR